MITRKSQKRHGSHLALDSGGSVNGELIRSDDTIKVRVRITICTKKYFDKEKPLIYLVSALTVPFSYISYLCLAHSPLLKSLKIGKSLLAFLNVVVSPKTSSRFNK